MYLLRRFRNDVKILGIKSIYYFILAALKKKKVLYKIYINDYAYPFYIRLPSSDIPTFKQIFIDREYCFETKYDPNVIIDAGANIGLASIFFANKYPNATIIAIEPERSNFKLLKENTRRYKNIIVLERALWDKNETINLLNPGLGKWGFMTAETEYLDTQNVSIEHKVKAITLDSILEEFQIDKIDILKIDIEGAEKEVFDNSATWIKMVESIIAELHERMKPGCNRSFYLATNGFDKEWVLGENIYLSRDEFLNECE